MFHTRTTKTSSGAIAVQVVRYKDRRLIIEQLIGSVHDKKELQALKRVAKEWIETNTKQLPPPSRRENNIEGSGIGQDTISGVSVRSFV